MYGMIIPAVGAPQVNASGQSAPDYAGIGPYAYSEVDQTKPYMQVRKHCILYANYGVK